MLKLKEITKTFSFQEKHLQIIEQSFIELRENSQIVIGIMGLCSIISIYSISQLTSIPTSSDDELINNTYHIIFAIESHDNRIKRSKEDIARLMKYITKFSKEVYVMNDVQMNLARIFSIKTYAIESKSHLDNIKSEL